MDSNLRFLVVRPSNRHGRRDCYLENGSGSVGEPKVRIHLPPALSQRQTGPAGRRSEAAIANYIYRGEVVRRQTGRHHAAGPTPRTQFRAKDGTYVCALVDRHSFGGAMVAGGVQCVSKTL
jgi:hypothetical protein